MSIHNKIGDKIIDIRNIYVKISNKKVSISNVYTKIGDQLVLLWTTLREAFSAFGAGWWQNDKPWSNEDGWKNG